VTLVTLGYGDIVALDGWLRLVSPLEALMGFVLLTAGLTWVMQVHPALTRRRTAAVRLDQLRRNRLAERLRSLESAAVAGLLLDLAAEVSRVRVDLSTYSQTYFFWDEGAASLPAALDYALQLADAGGRHHRDDVTFAAGTLATSLDDLAAQLRQDFVTAAPDTPATFEAYARANQTGGA
jgi:hypothetical protein